MALRVRSVEEKARRALSMRSYYQIHKDRINKAKRDARVQRRLAWAEWQKEVAVSKQQ